MYFDTDREALEACFMTIGDIPINEVRIVYIKDTLQLSKLYVSQAFEEEVNQLDQLKRAGEWKEMALDRDGNIMSPFSQ